MLIQQRKKHHQAPLAGLEEKATIGNWVHFKKEVHQLPF